MKYKPNSYGYVALRDLSTATLSYKTKNIDSTCLFMQQAIEKILKQYLSLTYKGLDYTDMMHSHKLNRLAKNANIFELKEYTAFLLELGDYYFDGRYPGINYDPPTWEQAKDFYTTGVKVFTLVEKAIDNMIASESNNSSSGLGKLNLSDEWL